jgi:ribosomal protein S27AE
MTNPTTTVKPDRPQKDHLDHLEKIERTCPNCGAHLEEHKCELKCPVCAYFKSCSDY